MALMQHEQSQQQRPGHCMTAAERDRQQLWWCRATKPRARQPEEHTGSVPGMDIVLCNDAVRWHALKPEPVQHSCHCMASWDGTPRQQVHDCCTAVTERWCLQGNLRCMVDAEQSYMQPVMDALTIQLQQRFNRSVPVIFNTYQCYLKSTEHRCGRLADVMASLIRMAEVEPLHHHRVCQLTLPRKTKLLRLLLCCTPSTVQRTGLFVLTMLTAIVTTNCSSSSPRPYLPLLLQAHLTCSAIHR